MSIFYWILVTSRAPACKVIERTARINLVNCVMKKCLHGFAAEHGGEVHMNNCLLSDMQACGGGRESSFSFRNTVFENCRQIFLTSNSRAVLDRCRLKYDKVGHRSPLDDFNYDCTAIVVSGGSRCSVSRSSFEGFDLASCVSNFGSKLTLQHCHLETDSGLGVSMNGQAKVLDCTIQLEFIVLMHNVELGSVEFKRNRHLSLDTPKIVKDAKSADVDHDFVDAVTIIRDCDRHLAEMFPSAKEQSRFTRRATAELRQKGHNMSTQDFVDPRNHYMYKHCMRCFRVEDIQAGIINVDGAEEESEDLLEDVVVDSKPEKVKKKKERKKKDGDETDEEEIDMYEKVSREPPKTVKEKFGYCRRCKKACYCSRECQLADWPDHKLLCETLTKISS